MREQSALRLDRRTVAMRLVAGSMITVASVRVAWPWSPMPRLVIRFNAGSAELDPTAQNLLQRMAARAVTRPDFLLLAIGYADAAEREAASLPMARAIACAVFLRLNGVAESAIRARAGDSETLRSTAALGAPAEEYRVASVEWIYRPDRRPSQM